MRAVFLDRGPYPGEVGSDLRSDSGSRMRRLAAGTRHQGPDPARPR